MSPEELAHELGMLAARFAALNERFAEHLEKEGEWHNRIEDALKSLDQSIDMIDRKISEANGARKVLVWLVGIVMFVIAFIFGQHLPK